MEPAAEDGVIDLGLLRGLRMSRAEDYRRYAAECLRVAQQIGDPTDKAMLVQMAQKWRELAQKAEKQAEDEGAD